jgi:hypothetical protein
MIHARTTGPINTPVLSFAVSSSDGSMQTYSLMLGNIKVFAMLFGAIMLIGALALAKAYEIILSVVGFFLTAPAEDIVRLFAMLLTPLIVAGLLGIAPLAIQFFRSQVSKKGGPTC